MNPREEKVYKETKIRNLKRTLAKLALHPELVDEYFQVKRELDELE